MKLIDLLVQELPKFGGWPEGCIFAKYVDVYVYYYADDHGFICPMTNHLTQLAILPDDYTYATVTRDQYEAALAASQKPEWNGDGLPPAGTVCEYMKMSLAVKEWTECTIDYVGSSFIVYRDCYGVELTSIKCDIEFRPLRSEADKKREDTCMNIYELIRHRSDIAEAIYDAIAAGEIPGVKLDD